MKLGDVADVVVGLQTGDNDYYIRQSKPRIRGASKNYEVVNFDLVLKEDELERIAGNEPLRFAVIIAGIVKGRFAALAGVPACGLALRKELDSPRYGDLKVEFNGDVVNVYDDDELLTISGGGSQSFKLDKGRPSGSPLRSGESHTVTVRDRHFGGRYYVPYDKGGASDIEEGWLPNYYVPTDYFIDWSEDAVHRMKTLTIADRIRLYDESKKIQPRYENTTCAVIRNPSYYFREGISFSRTGEYCPTFRRGGKAPFDTEGSMIFVDNSLMDIFGLLPSTLLRFLFKVFIDHTVHLQIEDVKKLPKPRGRELVLAAVSEIGRGD